MAGGMGGGAGSGYGSSLFDAQGPVLFARAVDTVAKSIGDVNAGFVQMAQKSSTALEGISTQFSTILSQASQFSQMNIQGPGGGPGGVQPAGNNGGVTGNTGGVGGDSKPPPSPGGKQTGLPVGGDGKPAAGPGGAGKPPGGDFGILGQLGPGTARGAAAGLAQSAAGSVAGFVQKQAGANIQAAVYGAQAARTFGGNVSNPAGYEKITKASGGGVMPLIKDQSDWYQEQQVALQSGGIGSAVAPYATAQTKQQQGVLTQSVNTFAKLNPGTSATSAANAFFSLNAAPAQVAEQQVGLNFRPGGNIQDIGLTFQQLLDKAVPQWKTMGVDNLLQQLIPGRSGLANIMQITGGAIQPGTDAYDALMKYAQAAGGYAAAHNGAAPPTGPAGDAALQLNTGKAYDKLASESAKAIAKSQTTPDINQATGTFDKAVKTFSNAVNALLGGGSKGSTPTGFLSKNRSWMPSWMNTANRAVNDFLFKAPDSNQFSNLSSSATNQAYITSDASSPPTTQTGQTATLAADSSITPSTPTAGTQSPTQATLMSARIGPSATPASGAAAVGLNLARGSAGAGGTGASPSPSTTGTPSTTTPTPAAGGGGTATQNQTLGKSMAASMGWTGADWTALQALWQQESGWRTDAKNPSSGAYGIPQSLPANKMASAGPDYLTNPKTQIQWGLGYIKDRYGSPSAAEAHEKKFNWYATGTYNIAATQLAMLHRGERIIPAGENNAAGRYNTARTASGGGLGTVHLNFTKSSIVVMPAPATTPMDPLPKTQALAKVRSS